MTTVDPYPTGPDLPDAAGPRDYLAPYREMVGKVGPSFEALLWASPRTQTTRFRVIASMINLTGRIVLDAGCGRGDLCAWLDRQGVQYGRYIGLDAVPELLEAARAQNLPEAEFLYADFVADPEAFRPGGAAPEVIVFSGSLNTMDQPVAMTVLERAWQDCAETLVFNFLSDRHHPRRFRVETGPAQRFNTMAMLEWALSRTPLVRFRQDYLKGNDATIVMHKH